MGRLSDSDIDAALTGTEWRRAGEAIERELELGGFTACIDMVNRIAALAEEANHHPDLLVHSYRRLRITLSTHSEGGVTASDVDLARRIDALGAGPEH